VFEFEKVSPLFPLSTREIKLIKFNQHHTPPESTHYANMSATGGEPLVRAYTRKRKLDQVSEDSGTIETPLALNSTLDAPNNSHALNSTALSIRNKLKSACWSANYLINFGIFFAYYSI
jgi:hypothetical protein